MKSMAHEKSASKKVSDKETSPPKAEKGAAKPKAAAKPKKATLASPAATAAANRPGRAAYDDLLAKVDKEEKERKEKQKVKGGSKSVAAGKALKAEAADGAKATASAATAAAQAEEREAEARRAKMAVKSRKNSVFNSARDLESVIAINTAAEARGMVDRHSSLTSSAYAFTP